MSQDEWDKMNDDWGFPRSPLPSPKPKPEPRRLRTKNTWMRWGRQLTQEGWAETHIADRLTEAQYAAKWRECYPPEGGERPWYQPWGYLLSLKHMSDDELEAYRRAVAAKAVGPNRYWGTPRTRAWTKAHVVRELEMEMLRRKHPLS